MSPVSFDVSLHFHSISNDEPLAGLKSIILWLTFEENWRFELRKINVPFSYILIEGTAVIGRPSKPVCRPEERNPNECEFGIRKKTGPPLLCVLLFRFVRLVHKKIKPIFQQNNNQFGFNFNSNQIFHCPIQFICYFKCLTWLPMFTN